MSYSRIFLSGSLIGSVRAIGHGEEQVFVTRLLLDFEKPNVERGENLEHAPVSLLLRSANAKETACSLSRNAPVFIQGAVTPRSAIAAFKVRRGHASRRRPPGYVIDVDGLQLTGDPEKWIARPHASPEPHQVTRHERTLKSGRIVQVRSYWTGRKRLDPSS